MEAIVVPETISRAIVFISSDIPDSQTLIDGILKGIVTAILDPNRDAVAQIAAVLKGKQYSTLHIISHGAIGHLQLGNTQLNWRYNSISFLRSGVLSCKASYMLDH